MSPVAVRLRGVERRFGAVRALAGADLELHAGEVHGVLGANGAGKSTLFNVLGGLLAPDAGELELDGDAVSLSGPRDAWAHGIGLVHQHFTLVPALTVLENLALGVRNRSREDVRARATDVMAQTGFQVPLDQAVEGLGVGDRQRTEILKALLREPAVIALDEPTAVLAPAEVRGLFGLLRTLAAEGRAVAIVAHKLDEVLAVSDRVTVLRDGRTVLTAPRAEVDQRALVAAMIGDGVSDAIALGIRQDRPPSPASVTTPVVASLSGVSGTRLDGVDLSVRAGEVVGVAGVEGNGQHELALILSGRAPPASGAVDVPSEVAFIPQDRQREGLVADFDLTENVALALARLPEHASSALVAWPRMRERAESLRTRFDVAAPSVATRAGALSGGNQQRVIIARELELGAPLLVAENPTRGLDVEACAFVHEELSRLAADGVAVVLISTDLDEVLALSTRVVAISRGRLVSVPEEDRTRQGVGALMLSGEES